MMQNCCMASYIAINMHSTFLYKFVYLFEFLLQFPSELDPWKLLQKHILEDYMGHEVSKFTEFCVLLVYSFLHNQCGAENLNNLAYIYAYVLAGNF